MSCLAALTKFHHIYAEAYQARLGELPRCYSHGRASPCLLESEEADTSNAQLWHWVSREVPADFANVAHAMEFALHRDIDAFYGQFFAGPLQFTSQWGDGELIQPWNEDDFVLLQQNILGHLMMKKQLKQPQTWFIGLIGDEEHMLTVKNDDGSVWCEVPGQEPHQRLADNLESFITTLAPRVAPPQRHEEPQTEPVSHPGLMASMKRMWHNLLGR